MKTSKLFTLNWQDLLNGLLTAVAASVVSVVTAMVNNGDFNITFAAVWHGALVGGLGYLSRKFLTPADPIKEVTKDEDGTVTKTVIKTDQVDVTVKP